MNDYAILCLDNNPVSAAQYQKELGAFKEKFDLYIVDSLTDAQHTLDFIHEHSQHVALAIASHHQANLGADFLIHLDQHPHTKTARKVLISAGKDIQAILAAVNEGRLDHCLTKPLPAKILYRTVYKELTNFILEKDPDNILNYSNILDSKKLLRAKIEHSLHHFRQGFINDYHQMTDSELAESVIVSLYSFFEKNDETNACRTYSANHLLTKEGEENRFLWFITNGEVALFKKDEHGQEREVVRHPKGNLVGGMSFVTGEKSFSTAITVTRTHVIKLDRDVFASVMHSDTQLLPLFTNLLLRHFNRRLQRSILTKLKLEETLESLESTQNQLVEQEKLAVLGQLVAGVAHELNNPIAAILRSVETLTQQVQWIFNTYPEVFPQDAIQLLEQSMTVSPMSTAEERQKSRELEKRLGDRLIARKLVKLRLNEREEILKQLQSDQDNAQAYINQLEHVAKTGSTLRSVQICAQRIADMVKGLKSYARTDKERISQVDVHEGIEDTLVIFENRLKRHHVTKEYAQLPLITGQPTALQQVWVNLISNAIDALPEKNGRLKIITAMETHHQHTYIKVSIEDNGSGIPEEMKAHIFDLNFTTKKEGNFGLGIGLSVCQQIIQQHNGWIDLDSTVGQGTAIHVFLSASQQ